MQRIRGVMHARTLACMTARRGDGPLTFSGPIRRTRKRSPLHHISRGSMRMPAPLSTTKPLESTSIPTGDCRSRPAQIRACEPSNVRGGEATRADHRPPQDA